MENNYALTFIFISLLFAALTGTFFGHIIASNLMRYFRTKSAKNKQRKMIEHIDVYDDAIELFMNGETELGELRIQEYSKLTGVDFMVAHFHIKEDGTQTEGESDIFHPDGYGDFIP